ncbi:CDP-glucose 4,6-dehydratase [Spirochaetia bacterium]|nr:CDP-glucose 4,6-dehydratase [Spirochaetia bacterium]
MDKMEINNFYHDKKIFITGHTGFKGSWLCTVLTMLGAKVKGYALPPSTAPNLFNMLDLDIESIIGDIRDLEKLEGAVSAFQPDIVIHLAAQPIVLVSYKQPVYTYDVNVMGTVHILEAVRNCTSVRSFLNVTTDKVYRNNEWEWGYRETDALDGYDPYSNSKSCSELITASYRRAFFADRDVAVSTARAGNVIGGGDYSPDRIIPDCVRSAEAKKEIVVRNPLSIRPYQHVLEPIFAYLLITQKQYENRTCYEGNYNVGPNETDCVTTEKLVEYFCAAWGDGAHWAAANNIQAQHEANYLKLDHSRIGMLLDWHPKWDIEEAVKRTVEFSKVKISGGDVSSCMREQIEAYMEATV